MNDPDKHAHLIDAKTWFCKKCGNWMEPEAARVKPCEGGGNVVGVSHLIMRNILHDQSDRTL